MLYVLSAEQNIVIRCDPCPSRVVGTKIVGQVVIINDHPASN